MNDIKIAAAIILYKPDENIIDNLNSIAGQVDKLFLLNNSPAEFKIDKNTFPFYSNSECINFYKNLGVASALNKGAEIAFNQGYEYLLLIDQDSKVQQNFVENYVAFIKNNNEIKWGILAPVYIYKDYKERGIKNYDYPIDDVMTS